MTGAKVRTPFLAGQSREKRALSVWVASWNIRASRAAAGEENEGWVSRSLAHSRARGRRTEQVVGGGNGVDISSQVKVELREDGSKRSARAQVVERRREDQTHLSHRDDLRVSSSSSSSLDTESRSLGRLSNTGEGGLVEVSSELRETRTTRTRRKVSTNERTTRT